jgi:hypothetical protein
VFTKTADEEAVQFRALNLLFGPLGVRGCPQPECSHPQWNDYCRAVESSGLNGTSMKCTIVANYGAGPYLEGKNLTTMRQGSEDLMSKVSGKWLEEASESIAFDRGLPHCRATAEDWTDALNGRIRFVQSFVNPQQDSTCCLLIVLCVWFRPEAMCLACNF